MIKHCIFCLCTVHRSLVARVLHINVIFIARLGYMFITHIYFNLGKFASTCSFKRHYKTYLSPLNFYLRWKEENKKQKPRNHLQVFDLRKFQSPSYAIDVHLMEPLRKPRVASLLDLIKRFASTKVSNVMPIFIWFHLNSVLHEPFTFLYFDKLH